MDFGKINIETYTKFVKDKDNALNIIYEQYSSLLFGICLRYCKDKEDAEDLLQESFIKIMNNLDMFSCDGSFEGWLKRITLNTCCYDYYTKKKKDYKNISFEPDFQFDNEDTNILDKLKADDILKLVQELPYGYRTVFNMHVIDGFKHKDIAEMLGIEESTSRSQYLQARLLLQKKIKNIYKNEKYI